MTNDKMLLWLLEENDPAIRYRTLTSLANEITEEQLKDSRDLLISSDQIQNLINIINDPNKMEAHIKTFGKFAGFVILNMLGESGLTRKDVEIDHLANYLIDRGFKQACGEPLILRSFVMTGYEQNPIVKKAIKELFMGLNFDNGLKCISPHKKYKHSNPPKSCGRITSSLLLLAAELSPNTEIDPYIAKLINYFTSRDILYRKEDMVTFLYSDIANTIFPIDPINIGLQSYVYALAKLGYGNHSSLDKTWLLVEKCKNSDGAYILNKPKNGWVYFDGKKNKPNKWITLYILLANKYKNEVINHGLI